MKSNYSLDNIEKMIKKRIDGKIFSKNLAEKFAFKGWFLYSEKLRLEKKESSEKELCREILYNLSVDYDLLEAPVRNKKRDREGVNPGEVEFSKKYLQAILDSIAKFKSGKKYKLPTLRTK